MVATVQVKADAKPLRSPARMDHANAATAGTVFAETLRGVRCVRLSVLTDETTSPGRQREADDNAAAALNISFSVGDAVREAVDLDVSASKIGPFDRPELGKWLARPDEFDVLVWWRFDRAIRSMADMHELAKWAKRHRKMLVFAEGIGGGRLVFDFRNVMDPMSELMMMMFAFAAQVESQSISDRVTGAQAAMRKMPLRWRGSRPPYGYMPASMPEEDGGSGWTLIPDPDAVAILERIIGELLDGKSTNAVAAGLNADKILSPRDHWAAKKNRQTGGKTGGAKGAKTAQRDVFKWTHTAIVRILRNPALLGWKTHQGNPVRDSAGTPVMLTSTPILDRTEFDRIGALLDGRSVTKSDRKDTNALLLRIIHCDSCGARMYLDKGRDAGRGANYRCTSRVRGVECVTPANIRADWVDEYVIAEFLRLAGPIQVTHVQTIPGYDPAPEIFATLAEFKAHQEEKGRQKSRAALSAWQERADALDNRLEVLENTPKVEPRQEVIRTHRTYADEWMAKDTAERRQMLVEAGVRLTVKRGTRGGWRKLDESRVSFEIREAFHRGAVDALLAVREDTENDNRLAVPTPEGTRLRLWESETNSAAQEAA